MARLRKLICATACTFAAALLLLLALAWISLPSFVEGRLRDMVAAELPAQPFRCTVRRIGLQGADLGDIVLGAPENPALVIDSLRLDYSFSRLRLRQVDGLVLSGLRLRGRLQDGQFVLEGFPPPEEKEPPESLTPPFALGLVRINGALLSCRVGEELVFLPFSGRIVPENPKGPGDVAAPLVGDFTLLPQGQELRLRARADLAEKHLRLSLAAPGLDLQRFAGLAGMPMPVGRLRLEASAAMALAPLVLKEAQARAVVDGLEALSPDGTFRASAPESTAVSLALADGQGRWRLRGTTLALRGPVPASLRDFEGAGTFSADALEGSGTVRLLLQPPGFAAIPARAEIRGNWTRQGKSSFSLRAVPEAAPDPAFQYKSLSLRLEQARDAPLHLAADMASFRLRPGQGRELFLPAVSLRSRGSSGPAGMELRGEARLAEGIFHDPGSGLRLEGISAALPLAWPVVSGGAAGSAAVRSIALRERPLGSLALQVRQQGFGVALEGEHQSRLVEGLVAAIHGEVAFSSPEGSRGTLAVRVGPRRFSALPLGRLAGLGQEANLTGTAALEGSFSFSGKGYGGTARLDLQEGHLALPGKDVVLEGVRLALLLPGLPALRSPAGQPFSFAGARVGSFVLGEGAFRFQLEPPSTLFVEGGEVAWCGGRLHTQSLRVVPDKGEYAVTLFADRLNLAQVLAQFGLREAEGEGTLSGRIPFVASQGRVVFDDAFLSSAPGEGGIIRLPGLGLLASGVPRNSPQFAQLDFTGEALRNFRYNWARLRLITEQDELLVQLQLDGQPAQPIPFRYDGRIGTFSRLLPGETGGIVHPVRLDMNLRLPLEKIMEYGGGIQKLLKNP